MVVREILQIYRALISIKIDKLISITILSRDIYEKDYQLLNI